jgi:hypothetical protein
MMPIMNGVVLYLGNYHQTYRTDLYGVGDCYVFVVSPGQLVEGPDRPFKDVHFLLDKIVESADLWRSPDRYPYGLLVTPRFRLEKGGLWTYDLEGYL